MRLGARDGRAERGGDGRSALGARGEPGFVLVFVTITLSLLLLSAGLSVDLGSFYREGAQLQRAVDAAALAGVVYMPGDFGTAQSVARTTMAKNGFVDGAGGLAVSVNSVPGNAHRLKVCATDSQVETYFTKIINYQPTISKCGTAEYELPVPMGSPLNEMSSAALGGIDLAINGYCTASEDGDKINSRYRAMFTAPNRATGYVGCPPPSPNYALYYSPDGYSYVVEVVDSSQPITVEVYDAGFTVSSPLDGIQAGTSTTPQRTDTYYRITDGTLTPLDPTDDPLYGPGNVVVNAGDASWAGRWSTLFTIPAGSRTGRYRIRITTSTNPDAHDLNGFRLRARVGSTFTRCSADPNDAIYSPSCPQVFAEDHLGVSARTSGSTAVFYLASIDAQYAGRELTVSLFDPAEGGQSIELLDPNGNPVSFAYDTPDSALDPSLPRYSGSGVALDVSGTPGRMPGRINPGKFNERNVTLVAQIPSDYATRYGTRTWWRLRYRFGSGSVGDRTTWEIAIDGDPVRLVDGR